MKVGDYVRTDKGNISKIKWISQEIICLNETKSATIHLENDETIRMYYGDIIKSSPNIIDLIEVGDYINGYLVKDIDYAFDDVVMNNKNARVVPYIDCNKNNYVDDIKTIVTKQQFEAMEYKIGGNE